MSVLKRLRINLHIKTCQFQLDHPISLRSALHGQWSAHWVGFTHITCEIYWGLSKYGLEIETAVAEYYCDFCQCSTKRHENKIFLHIVAVFLEIYFFYSASLSQSQDLPVSTTYLFEICCVALIFFGIICCWLRRH